MKANVIGSKTIGIVNHIMNLSVLTLVILLIAFAGYVLWDSDQLFYAAEKSHYAVYKPSVEDEGKSFKELQALNAEVIAWLSIYGTNIDYPVTQGPNNMKYIDTNAEGQYSLSGAIFLDSNNKKDFSDHNNILHGHHMAKKVMFGEIGNFADRKMFDEHRYGNLYFDEKDHGIEFFAFLHTDAYNTMVYTPGVKEKDRQKYLDNLLAKAMYTRDIGMTADDQIVLLSTCSSGSTNGRDVLIGRLTDGTHEDPFAVGDEGGRKKTNGQNGLLKEIHLLNILLIALLIVFITIIYFKRKHKKGVDTYDCGDEKEK